MVTPMRDKDGICMDREWLKAIGNLAELSFMPPKSIRRVNNDYLIDKTYLTEPVLSELAVTVYNHAEETPDYVWQIIASAGRVCREETHVMVHDMTWTTIKRQKKMIVDTRNAFPSSKALCACFDDFYGTWTEDLEAWNNFFAKFRLSLAKFTWDDADWSFPLCTHCVQEDDKAFKVFRRNAPPELSCLENWLRRWLTNNNVMTYKSAFPELQAKAYAIKLQYRAKEEIIPDAWPQVFKAAFPTSQPDPAFLETIEAPDQDSDTAGA